MAEKKGEEKEGRFVDLGRAETEIYVPDPEIAEVFESDKHGHGARSGGQKMMHDLEQHGSDDIAGGDPDADAQDATFVGEEAPGGGNPTPGQDLVDGIGGAVGLQYQDNE